MKHFIGQTRNSMPVYVDLVASDAAKSISQHPFMLGLLTTMLSRVALRDAAVTVEQDMGHTIGYNFVVDTTDQDIVFYAQLQRDSTYTRFVKNAKPSATSYLTASFHRVGIGKTAEYELDDAWVGRNVPPRPGSPQETTKSKPFWARHAVIMDRQLIRANTITKICPYSAD